MSVDGMITAKSGPREETKGLDSGMYFAYACRPTALLGAALFVH
jgi:hypothetical protein